MTVMIVTALAKIEMACVRATLVDATLLLPGST